MFESWEFRREDCIRVTRRAGDSRDGRRRLLMMVLVLVLLRRPLAHADVPPVSVDRTPIEVVGRWDACPSPEGVADSLRTLLRRHVVVPVGQGAPDTVSVALLDLGDQYHVQVRGEGRTFEDEARGCDERARTAAVLVAMVLEPASAPPPSPRARTVRVELEAAGAFEAAPAYRGFPIAGGADVGLSVGARRGAREQYLVAGVVRVGVRSPATLALGSVEVRFLRVPITLSLRGAVQRGRIEGLGEIGLLISPTTASWTERDLPYRGSGLGVGLHALLLGRLWLGTRVAPFLGLQLDVVPVPPEVRACTSGDCAQAIALGATPRLLAGVLAGLAVRIR